MKKFIKPIKKIEDLVLWKNKVKEIAPLPVFAFFVVALDTGVSPQFLLNLKWSDLKRDEIVSEIQVSEPYFEVYCELAGETRQIRFGNESLEILNDVPECVFPGVVAPMDQDCYDFFCDVINRIGDDRTQCDGNYFFSTLAWPLAVTRPKQILSVLLEIRFILEYFSAGIEFLLTIEKEYKNA